MWRRQAVGQLRLRLMDETSLGGYGRPAPRWRYAAAEKVRQGQRETSVVWRGFDEGDREL